MRTLLLTVLAGLALPAAAAAGGFATAGVTPLPDGDRTWTPTLMIKQHGRTPLDGLMPSIAIVDGSTGETRTFPATPTGKRGEYRARVVFPHDGTWSYTVADGFSRVHTFKPVKIVGAAGAAAAPADGSFPLGWALAAIGGTIGLAVGVALLSRRGVRAALSPH